MSIVVAVAKDGEIVMAADSQDSFGDINMPADNCPVTKILRVGKALLGTTGWAVYGNILEDYLAGKTPVLTDERKVFRFFLGFWKAMHETYSFVDDQSRNDDAPFADLDSSFLVATGDRIFSVSSQMSVSRFLKYQAIGSGDEFALGALHALYDRGFSARELAVAAVESAITFDSACGGPVEVLTP